MLLFSFCFTTGIKLRDERFTDEKAISPFTSRWSCFCPPLQPNQQTCREDLIIKKQDTHIGVELLSFLKQQRYLYHELKILAEREQELAGTSSPELVIEVVTGRRKVMDKLRELNDKLRPIKRNWETLSQQIGSECKARLYELTDEVREIAAAIPATGPSDTAWKLPAQQDWGVNELLAEAQLK